MKRLRTVFTILMIVGVILSTGCAPSGRTDANAEQLPRYNELTALIGLQREDVLARLELEESELTTVDQIEGVTPLVVEYGGVELRIQLGFGPLDGVLNGITYLAIYENEPDRAAKEMLSTAKNMLILLGEPDAGNLAEPVWKMSEEDVVEAISERKNLSKLYDWYLNEGTTETMMSYMQELEETDLYKGHKEFGMDPGFTCVLNMSAYTHAKSEEATAYLMISYQIGFVPSK